MNYNTIGYLTYLPIIGFITVYIGKQCHTHGLIFVKQAINEESTAEAVNNMLLVGYYLINLGYAVMALTQWRFIDSWAELVSEIASQIGYIVIILAGLHYVNILTLLIVRKFNTHNKNNTSWKIH